MRASHKHLLLAAAFAVCTLAACDWLRGGRYSVRGIEPIVAPEKLSADQQDFFEIIDTVAKYRGMRAATCSSGVAETRTCRTYRTDSGIFLNGFLNLNTNEYAVSVYEWNVRNRSPLALDIEREVVQKLRARFGEKVITQHHDGV
jgi:hypothetical protein